MAKPAKVVKATPSVAKPAKPVTEVDRSIPTEIRGKVYFLGGSTYNPRAFQNISQWDKMVEMLNSAGDKGVAGIDLAKSLTVNEKHPEKAHFNFVSYLERRGALVHRTKEAK